MTTNQGKEEEEPHRSKYIPVLAGT